MEKELTDILEKLDTCDNFLNKENIIFEIEPTKNISDLFKENGKEKYRERPKAYDFIQEMAKHYELVIFTAGLQDVIYCF